MALPVDLSKIKDLVKSMKNDSLASCNVNVYVDSTANIKFSNFIQSILKDSCSNTVISFHDWTERDLYLEDDVDLCIFIANSDPLIVVAYEVLCSAGFPCIILTITPQLVVNNAVSYNININNTDVICPSYDSYYFVEDCPNPYINFDIFTKKMAVSILDKLIDWFLHQQYTDPLFYASKIDFLKEPYAKNVISNCSIKNAGVGLVKFIPNADMSIMTYNQIEMVLSIAAAYGRCSDLEKILDVLTLSASAFGLKYLSSKVKGLVKILPSLINAVFGFGSSHIIGNLALTIFREGGSVEDFVLKIANLFSSGLSRFKA